MDEFDESFVCDERDELIEKIKISYSLVNSKKKQVLIFGVDGKIEQYVTPEPSIFNLFKTPSGLGNLPPEEYEEP